MVYLLTYLLLFTLLTSGLTHFFQMTMQKGMVFRRYKYFIKYYLDYKPRKRYGYYPMKAGWVHIDVKPKWYSWFYKPLGGCYKCNGFWIFALMWLLINLSISELSITETLILIPLGAGMNYVFSQIMIQYFIL